MTATPKELLAAAETVASYLGRGGWYAIDREADLCARHIRSTVRADDDELIEGEYLETINHLCWPSNPAIRECRIQDYRFVWWKETAGVWRLRLSFCGVEMSISEVSTRGQFRSLCRALGLTLPEVPA